MIDYHIHTSHSIDAEGSLRDYCEKAITLGLKEICFTNHCELDQKRDDNLIRLNGAVVPITKERLLELQNEIQTQKESFKKRGLDIKFGIEVGYFNGVKARLEEIIDGLPLDYVIGGIHCLDHICIDSSKECKDYFGKNDAEDLLNHYFNTMEDLIHSKLFDSIAHFDVYKKYGEDYYGKRIDEYQREKVFHLFKLMAEYGIGLEINTAGLRRRNEFYPSRDFMKMAKDAGVQIITIGSDSHKPDDLGKGIKEAIEYLRDFGFQRIYGFEKRSKFPLDFF